MTTDTDNRETGSAAPSGYTPGPWTLNGPCGFADPSLGAIVYASHGNGHLVAAVEYHYSPETQPANARLIAAAPELLEACRLAADCIGDESMLTTLQQAIRNATGV